MQELQNHVERKVTTEVTDGWKLTDDGYQLSLDSKQ
jgi:hypothetical protein